MDGHYSMESHRRMEVGDNNFTFSVDSGMISVNGNTTHLFYDGL